MRSIVFAVAMFVAGPVFAQSDADLAAQAAERARQDVIAGKFQDQCQEPIANRAMVAVAQRYAAGKINRKQYEAEMIRLVRTSRYLWEPTPQTRSTTAAGPQAVVRVTR